MNTHNYFDFKQLPLVLNDIINENAQEMIDCENRREHRRHFQKTLDIIKSLTISYSANHNFGFVIYALDLPFDQECRMFMDNCYIFSWRVENVRELENVLLINDEDYLDYPEGVDTEDELLDMEDNDIEMS